MRYILWWKYIFQERKKMFLFLGTALAWKCLSASINGAKKSELSCMNKLKIAPATGSEEECK